MDWQPRETEPMDGSQVLFWSPAGGAFIAPSTPPREPTREEELAIYLHSGDRPDVKWNPTHWMPLPEPPSGKHLSLVTHAASSRA